MPFGVFVNILPGKDGMVHVSDMGREEFVADASDVVKIGDKIDLVVEAGVNEWNGNREIQLSLVDWRLSEK